MGFTRNIQIQVEIEGCAISRNEPRTCWQETRVAGQRSESGALGQRQNGWTANGQVPDDRQQFDVLGQRRPSRQRRLDVELHARETRRVSQPVSRRPPPRGQADLNGQPVWQRPAVQLVRVGHKDRYRYTTVEGWTLSWLEIRWNCQRYQDEFE